MDTKPTLKENRLVAWLVLAAAVLVGVLGIGTAKVRGVAGVALDYYRQNMAADFTARGDRRADPSGHCRAGAWRGRRQGADGCRRPGGKPGRRQPRRKNMRRAPSWKQPWALCTTRCLRPRGTRRKSAAQLAWSEFVSRTDILSHSMEQYNTYAQAAEKTLKGFPASLLAKLAGVEIQAMA